MSVSRFFAALVIVIVVTGAWMILGGTITYRTANLQESLAAEVNNLWGPSDVTQESPTIDTGTGKGAQLPVKADVNVFFDHHNRYKGLLWFSTYAVDFSGVYTVASPPEPADAASPSKRACTFIFKLPEGSTLFESLTFTLDKLPVEPRAAAERGANALEIALPADRTEHVVSVAYKTRGRDRWFYVPSPNVPDVIRNLTLTAKANFPDIDYPKDTVSPVQPAQIGANGSVATWHYDSVRMSNRIGLEMPSLPSAGPIAARISYFAPVSLLFFLTVIFTVCVLKKIDLHPMHCLFISAGFFAFHILLAYLIDLVNIHAAFWICSAVSLLLVVSYMRLVAGFRFAAVYVGFAQLVYLIGFGYAFFWAGRTGLTVTIGAVLTLFVLMQATGRVNWTDSFRRRNGQPQPRPEPPPTTPPGPPPLKPKSPEVEIC